MVPRTWSPASATRRRSAPTARWPRRCSRRRPPGTAPTRPWAAHAEASTRQPRGRDRRELTHTHVGHHQVREGMNHQIHGHAGRAGGGGKTGHGPDVLVGARLPDEPAHGGREERKAADPPPCRSRRDRRLRTPAGPTTLGGREEAHRSASEAPRVMATMPVIDRMAALARHAHLAARPGAPGSRRPVHVIAGLRSPCQVPVPTQVPRVPRSRRPPGCSTSQTSVIGPAAGTGADRLGLGRDRVEVEVAEQARRVPASVAGSGPVEADVDGDHALTDHVAGRAG